MQTKIYWGLKLAPGNGAAVNFLDNEHNVDKKNEINKEWSKAVTKIPLNILSKLALAATKLNNRFHGYPAHLIAAFGEIETFMFIAEKTGDINQRCKFK